MFYPPFNSTARDEATAARVWRLPGLEVVLITGQKWGHLQENPARGVDLPKLRTVRPKWALTPHQASALLDKLPPLGRAMVGLAILSGLRRGELFALRWQDIDEASRVLTIREAVYDGVFDVNPDAGSIVDWPAAVLETAEPRGPIPLPDLGPRLQAAATLATRAADGVVRHRLEDFLGSLDRRRAGDLRRLREYFDAVHQEIRQKVERATGEARERTAATGRDGRRVSVARRRSRRSVLGPGAHMAADRGRLRRPGVSVAGAASSARREVRGDVVVECAESSPRAAMLRRMRATDSCRRSVRRPRALSL